MAEYISFEIIIKNPYLLTLHQPQPGVRLSESERNGTSGTGRHWHGSDGAENTERHRMIINGRIPYLDIILSSIICDTGHDKAWYGPYGTAMVTITITILTVTPIAVIISTIMIINMMVYESHYNDVIMSAMTSQIVSLTIVYSTVYSGADQRKHQSSASLTFVRGIHRGPVNSPHKWSVTRKMFPFDDVIVN